jgi:hypothetical protein
MRSIEDRALGYLVGVRTILADKRNWAKNDYERVLKSGRTRYCLVGALRAVAGPAGPAYRAAYDWLSTAAAARSRLGGNPEDFNDTHTHREVLALLDQVIADAKDLRRG